jgi:hypothetical protein
MFRREEMGEMGWRGTIKENVMPKLGSIIQFISSPEEMGYLMVRVSLSSCASIATKCSEERKWERGGWRGTIKKMRCQSLVASSQFTISPEEMGYHMARISLFFVPHFAPHVQKRGDRREGRVGGVPLKKMRCQSLVASSQFTISPEEMGFW